MQRGTIFILVGLAMLIFGGFGSNLLATIVADTTPPQLNMNYVPALNGNYSSSLNEAAMYCSDPESGIASVYLTIDGQGYTLLKQTTSTWQYWNCSITPPQIGGHTFSFVVTNGVGLTTTRQGSFNVYGSLAGKWYVNNVEITSPTQVIYTQNLTVSFRFMKTAGPADGMVTAEVDAAGGVLLVALSNTLASVWTGSYTFPSGRTTIYLIASDGTNKVQMALIDMQFGTDLENLVPGGFSVYTAIMAFGAVFFGYGFWLSRKKLPIHA